MELLILRDYPLMSGWENNKFWVGFISICGTSVRIAIRTPNYPSIKDAILEGDSITSNLCNKFKTQIELKKILASNCSLLEFFAQIEKLIERELNFKFEKSFTVLNPTFYTELIEELQEINFKNIAFVSKNYTEIHLKVCDVSNREHILKCFLPSRYPNVGIKVYHELPISSDAQNIVWPSRIRDSFNHFIKLLGKYEEFWKQMDLIDTKTNVIEPSEPNRSNIHRRIVLSEAIIYLELDPSFPKKFPNIKFTGNDIFIEKYKRLVEINCKEWNPNQDILTNVEKILEQKIPPKEDDGCIGMQNACPICYMFEIEGEIPERTCKCGSNYHESCLNDLLINEFNANRQVSCPVCEADIKISLPKRRR